MTVIVKDGRLDKALQELRVYAMQERLGARAAGLVSGSRGTSSGVSVTGMKGGRSRFGCAEPLSSSYAIRFILADVFLCYEGIVIQTNARLHMRFREGR